MADGSLATQIPEAFVVRKIFPRSTASAARQRTAGTKYANRP
ncbi:hypothetical protein BTRA_4901 [Burkholderia thailandensis USAMRU Malaysia |nr:hypothetical protein BTQ_5510 [Burkholderia thailandensis 2002721723]AHI81017.1 hypothetical protein BTJ_4166 [Burkholderia thailandensis E444]AIC89734.1 hypothetical protein BTRA_4901 [Burkholderia thailandensis USAMRU Malaysia \